MPLFNFNHKINAKVASFDLKLWLFKPLVLSWPYTKNSYYNLNKQHMQGWLALHTYLCMVLDNSSNFLKVSSAVLESGRRETLFFRSSYVDFLASYGATMSLLNLV